MKKFLFAILALVLFTANVNAQKKKNFAWSKKVMNEIGLSAEQQAKVETIKSESTTEMNAVKADAGMAEEAKKTKLQDLQKKRVTAIEALLTAEQKKKADELKAKIKAENEGGQ